MPRQISVPKEADKLAREVTRLTKRSPADRSVLRHSLGKAPEDVALGVHRIVVPLLPKEATAEAERAYYAVAALIASQSRQARDQADSDDAPDEAADDATLEKVPDGTRQSAGRLRHNLGYSLARAVHEGSNEKNLEDRLQLLARQDTDGVHRHLPRLILQLRGDQVRIDWGVLVHDLTRWARDPRHVAKEWAQEFYRTSARLAAEKNRKAEQAANPNSNEEA